MASQNGRYIYYMLNKEHKGQSSTNDLPTKVAFESTLSIQVLGSLINHCLLVAQAFEVAYVYFCSLCLAGPETKGISLLYSRKLRVNKCRVYFKGATYKL